MTTSSIPLRSTDQRLDALRRANAVRLERRRFKRRLHSKDRQESIWLMADLINRPPAWALTMKVRDLLMAAPKWGHVKTDRFLGRARVSAVKTLGGLSERQRKEILGLLEHEAARR